MPDIRPLPEVLQIIACEELNEVPERIDQDLQDFREWIKSQPHLRARTDDQFLISFLRGCKYSLENAKSKIDKFYTLKTMHPDFYTIQNVDDPKVIELFKMGVSLHLPIPPNESVPSIHYVCPGNYPSDKYSITEVMSISNTFQELSMNFDDDSVINGFILILDMARVNASHILQFTPSVIKKISAFNNEALPLRQRSIHIINAKTGFDRFFNSIKSLLPVEQQQRLYVHGSNWESLYEHVPQKYLPKDLGGDNSSIDEIKKIQWEQYQKHRDYIIENKRYGVDENLRVGKAAEKTEQIFGIEGSFRKLQVD